MFSAPSQTQRTVAELAACRQELEVAIVNENLGVQELELGHSSKLSSKCLSSVTWRREVEPFEFKSQSHRRSRGGADHLRQHQPHEASMAQGEERQVQQVQHPSQQRVPKEQLRR